MTTCIRRPTSVWTNCKCDTCRTDMRRLAKVARNGLYQRPSSDRAWKTLDRLVAAGWSPKAIGSATDTPWRRWHATLREYATTGRRRTLSPSSCLALMNVKQPTTGHVGALGTRRRLRALARIGWDLYRLEELTGIGFTTLAQIRQGKTSRVSARFAATVARVYAEKCMTPGDSEQARRGAERKGWHGPLAWDRIDDAAEEPKGVGSTRTDRADVLADVDSWGGNATDACRALGIDRRTLQKWAGNHGCSELYRRLAGREAVSGNQYMKGDVA